MLASSTQTIADAALFVNKQMRMAPSWVEDKSGARSMQASFWMASGKME